MADDKIKIYIADDHEILINGLIKIFMLRNIDVVGYATCPEDVSAGFLKSDADILLLDIRFGNSMTGIDVLEKILNEAPKSKIVMMSQYENEYLLRRIYQLGAKAFINKGAGIEDFTQGIKAVNQGEIFYLEEMAKKLADLSMSNFSLSEREYKIFEMNAQGLSKSEIAGSLGLSTRTISNHIKELQRKFNVNSDHELMKLGFLHGIL